MSALVASVGHEQLRGARSFNLHYLITRADQLAASREDVEACSIPAVFVDDADLLGAKDIQLIAEFLSECIDNALAHCRSQLKRAKSGA